MRPIVCLILIAGSCLTGGATSFQIDYTGNTLPAFSEFEAFRRTSSGPIPTPNGLVANERMESRPTDTTAYTSFPLPTSNVGKFVVQWDGNIGQANSGMNTGFELSPNGPDYFRVAVGAFNTSSAYLQVLDDADNPGQAGFIETFPNPNSSYRYRAVIEEGTVRVTATDIPTGTVFFDYIYQDPDIDISAFDYIRFRADTTTSATAWIDNIDVEVVPDNACCAEFAAQLESLQARVEGLEAALSTATDTIVSLSGEIEEILTTQSEQSAGQAELSESVELLKHHRHRQRPGRNRTGKPTYR